MYAALCLVAIAVILIHGDGPHPRVVSTYPLQGDRYWPGGSAEIAFSQPMDQSSVTRSLLVSPGGEGQAAWYGNVLNLQPVGDWRPETTYRISLVGSVTDDQGRPLQTPISFSFHVHHTGHLGYCPYRGIRNVCELDKGTHRLLTKQLRPVQAYALSPDGSFLAFTAADATVLPHLFVVLADGSGLRRLTGGPYADSSPSWPVSSSSITYTRRPIRRNQHGTSFGPAELWNVNTDGSNNAQI
jgi:Bacterial Ig-like domain